MRSQHSARNTEFDYFCVCATVLDDQLAYTHRQLEASRPRAARIEEENSIAVFTFCNVAMAKDDDLKSRGFGLEIELRQVVQHVDSDASAFENFCLRQRLRPCAFVNVAAYGNDRRNSP